MLLSAKEDVIDPTCSYENVFLEIDYSNFMHNERRFKTITEQWHYYDGVNDVLKQKLAKIFSLNRDELFKILSKVDSKNSSCKNTVMSHNWIYFFRGEYQQQLAQKLLSNDFYDFETDDDFTYYMGLLTDSYPEIKKILGSKIDQLDEYAINELQSGYVDTIGKNNLATYYRYALHMGYVYDYRKYLNMTEAKGDRWQEQSQLFIDIGDIALIVDQDRHYLPQKALAAVKKLFANGEEQALETVLNQFKHCGLYYCSTPEYEGTLAAIAFFKQEASYKKIASYVQSENPFALDIARNPRYYISFKPALLAALSSAVKDKELYWRSELRIFSASEDIDPADLFIYKLRIFKILKNLD
ncbi:hypothetical protein N5853_00635 [Bartonella sp. HY329]|uniref:hypothetical protein n=1 Tax=unclassified Bartonella TaxID=2645622 RepID=UPI0021C723B0|nr:MULTISPECIES: hypothetical protein [unclassified Bartonella]UXM95200.1 hypothetical protein N5853_00635 [Bartonella sp. HY329]UXN09523.1 hypothetical protein N5852_00640 [Bartonella sp. HY328]